MKTDSVLQTQCTMMYSGTRGVDNFIRVGGLGWRVACAARAKFLECPRVKRTLILELFKVGEGSKVDPRFACNKCCE